MRRLSFVAVAGIVAYGVLAFAEEVPYKLTPDYRCKTEQQSIRNPGTDYYDQQIGSANDKLAFARDQQSHYATHPRNAPYYASQVQKAKDEVEFLQKSRDNAIETARLARLAFDACKQKLDDEIEQRKKIADTVPLEELQKRPPDELLPEEMARVRIFHESANKAHQEQVTADLARIFKNPKVASLYYSAILCINTKAVNYISKTNAFYRRKLGTEFDDPTPYRDAVRAARGKLALYRARPLPCTSSLVRQTLNCLPSTQKMPFFDVTGYVTISPICSEEPYSSFGTYEKAAGM